MVASDSNTSDGEQVHDSIFCHADNTTPTVTQHADQCPVASTSNKRKYTGGSDLTTSTLISVSSPPSVLTTVPTTYTERRSSARSEMYTAAVTRQDRYPRKAEPL